MMHQIRDWIEGWIETLRIMIREPELYRDLRGPFKDEDFTEVGPPDYQPDEDTDDPYFEGEEPQ